MKINIFVARESAQNVAFLWYDMYFCYDWISERQSPKGKTVLFMTSGSGSNGCQNKPAASGITTPFLTCYHHIGVRGG
jgi:hypothetical protein